MTLACLSIMGFANGMGIDQVICTVVEKYWFIQSRNWIMWPMLHGVRYFFLIPRHRWFAYKIGILITSIYASYAFYTDLSKDECPEIDSGSECEMDCNCDDCKCDEY